MKAIKQTMLLLTIIATMAACGEGGTSTTTVAAEITITIDNRTGVAIKDVAIDSSESGFVNMSYGSIGRDTSELLKVKSNILPKSIGLHWTNAAGDRQSKVVKLHRALGSSYIGPVRLVISTGGGVTIQSN